MNRAFYNGVSGTKTQQFGIDSWANNIANIGTNGYKANIPQFAEIFTNKLAQIDNAGPIQSDQGFGSRANSSAISMKQGSIVNSERDLDVAIMGEGWFGVLASDGEQLQFTRDGNFMFNVNGDVVNAEGAYLMGTMNRNINEDGIIKEVTNFIPLDTEGGQKKLHLPQNLILGAVPTKKVTLHGNLGVEGVVGKFGTKIITDKGEEHKLMIRFEKDLEQPEYGARWTMKVSIKDQKDKLLFEAEPTPLVFGSNGGLKSYKAPVIDNAGTKIQLDLGSATGSLLAIANSNISNDITADGIPAGNLIGYHVDEDGHVVGNFDNGHASAVGRIALYHFQNDQGLTKLGDNRFAASSNSGEPIFYSDSQGRATLGTKLKSHALEKANTSTAEALTQLIVMQKAFDANAKSITTGDQLIQAALRML